MSYDSMYKLGNDVTFQGRTRVCAYIECQSRLDDPDHPDWSNLAYDTLRGADHVMAAYIRMVARTQEIADAAGDPPIQTNVTDEQILTAVDTNYSIIASLWYNPDGTPWGGAYVPGEGPPAEEIPPEGEIPTTPAITAILPANGGIGTAVTLTGVGLSQTSKVNIYVDCTNLVVVDDGQVTATVDSGKRGIYDVVVTLADSTVLTLTGGYEIT